MKASGSSGAEIKAALPGPSDPGPPAMQPTGRKRFCSRHIRTYRGSHSSTSWARAVFRVISQDSRPRSAPKPSTRWPTCNAAIWVRGARTVLNRHLGGRNTIQRCVRMHKMRNVLVDRRGRQREQVRGPRNCCEHSVVYDLDTGRRRSKLGQAFGQGCCMGRWMGLDKLYNGRSRMTSRTAHGHGSTPTSLASPSGSIYGRRMSRRRGLAPVQLRYGSLHVDDQVKRFLSAFSSSAYRRSILRSFSSNGFRSRNACRSVSSTGPPATCLSDVFEERKFRCDENRPVSPQDHQRKAAGLGANVYTPIRPDLAACSTN